MSEETCATCHFWRSTETVELAHAAPVGIGQCRRHAPAVIGQFAGWSEGEHRVWLATQFPMTATVDWCGEFDSIERQVSIGETINLDLRRSGSGTPIFARVDGRFSLRRDNNQTLPGQVE